MGRYVKRWGDLVLTSFRASFRIPSMTPLAGAMPALALSNLSFAPLMALPP